MKVLEAVLSVALLHVATSSDVKFELPEPLFEVFSPKGLRVSVPDSKDIQSVEFFINVPSLPEALIQEVNQTDGSYWIYWNPDVVVNLYDKICYKLMIQHRGLYWKKEGVHVVQKVEPRVSRPNATDCLENQSQKITSDFSGLGNVEKHNKGMITTGKTSNFKSAYSLQKSSGLKPITKSTTSTTSGTFYVKPSGVMEATGYKKGSSFDSTKREGEQWQHYQSELTAEELENMRRLYGSGLYGFPHLQEKLFPSGGKMYEQSYMSSESKSIPGEWRTLRYGDGPMTTHQFHQTQKTHESSSVSHSKPVFQFHYGDSAGSGSVVSSNRQDEKLFRLEPLTKLPNPLPPQGTIFKTTEYVREEHTVPVGEVSQVDRETHTTPQKIVQVSQTGEFSSHNQEIVKPVYSHVSRSGEFSSQNQEIVKPAYSHASRSGEFSSQNQEIVKPVYSHVSTTGEFSSHNHEFAKPVYAQISTTGEKALEYNSGNLQTVERQDYSTRSRHYLGNIFTSVKTTKVTSPQECTLVPGVDYTSTGNFRELENYVNELSCLATLAESTMKEEIALLRQKNVEFSRKFEQLQQEVGHLRANCNCLE